ncbi:ECF-type sigma factor [Pseudomarimonas arenosa]|uniref:Sigma-70 family RNA polymerase sigma factor n=1 Tax=Pseudomarimonas arenosa TaxID=2774145 RepID=A0AAW3ZMF4_9GAMM|nr:ECF-type sigma factor [Pseudomarimonas arenosa]MBD8525847.1 sigma-70 family RNA polymerase sigma factor [Pseudomarimonas arenosa]
MTTPQDLALFEQIYGELKRRARALRRSHPSHTLDTTALVHESFLKLIESRTQIHDRTHLFRTAALAMRQILIDALRERQAEKRGGNLQRVELSDIELPQDDPAFGFNRVSQSLDRLREVDPRLADVFLLRAFAGLNFEDIGELTDVSRATAQRDFEAARAYLLSTVEPD